MDDGSLATNASPGAQDSKPLSSAAAQGPTRIRSLDVLRGVGVLGMLAVHIQLFAFPMLARWNPTAYGDFQGLNWWVWLATSVDRKSTRLNSSHGTLSRMPSSA